MSNGILTPIAQVSYPHLFEPQVFKGPDGKPDPNKEPNYSVTLVVANPKEAEYQAFKKAVFDFIVAARKGRPFPAKFNWPWREGTLRVNNDGEQIDGFTAECEYFRTWCKARPPKNELVVNQSGKKVWSVFPVVGPGRENIIDTREIYAGSLGRVFLRPYEYKNYGNGPGCSLSLEAFQKTGEGTPIGSAPVNADNVFTSVAGENTDFAALIGGEAPANAPPWA